MPADAADAADAMTIMGTRAARNDVDVLPKSARTNRFDAPSLDAWTRCNLPSITSQRTNFSTLELRNEAVKAMVPMKNGDRFAAHKTLCVCCVCCSVVCLMFFLSCPRKGHHRWGSAKGGRGRVQGARGSRQGVRKERDGGEATRPDRTGTATADASKCSRTVEPTICADPAQPPL